MAALLFVVMESGRVCLDRPSVCASLVQRSVNHVEDEIQDLVDSHADYYQYTKNDCGLFVFLNDSLLYWNTNEVGPKVIRRRVEMGNDTICNLLTGDYYVKSFRKGNLNYFVFKQLNTTYRIENAYLENRFQPYHKLIKNQVQFGVDEGFAIVSKSGKTLTRCQVVARPRGKNVYWNLFVGIDALVLAVGCALLLTRNRKPKSGAKKFKIEYGVAFIILAAFVLTYLYNKINNQREDRDMVALAQHLSDKRDAAFEASFEKFAAELKADTALREMVFAESNVLSDVVLGYSQELLFDEVMKEYSVTLTLCGLGEEIAIQPENYIAECDDYFMEKLANNPQERVARNLYFIDYNTLDPNYLGKLSIVSPDSLQQKTLYFEFYKPIVPEGFGFPQLLQEKNSQKPYDYSVANYRDDILVYKYGKYIYPNFFKDQKGKDGEFRTAQGYKHYTLKSGKNSVLVISAPKKDWSEVSAPFAFFFLVLLIPYLLFCWVLSSKESKKGRTFRQKLQSVMLFTLVISFLAIAPVSIVYMQSVYNQKTVTSQYETTRTLSTEIGDDLDLAAMMGTTTRDTWTEILQHYAATFFTDLNLYGVDGRLMATTRQEIYEYNLQAPLMNAEAYQQMHLNKALYFTHEEHLGKGSYESAYVPLTDAAGNTLAYLNTPYFSSSTDLHQGIRNFVLTYINIILLLLGFALVFVLRLTKRLTQPLALMQSKMRDIKIDQKNEPIEWKGDDEIGALVKQYNQLIVELEKSAAELRRTTTESAWRGVARQVAHEIKNSLTPMRLSVQMLQRSMERGDADVEEKMQRTANTLIEQIDALSDIASSFSTYAKLPENHPAPIDLAELIQNVVNLYDNAENITFRYDYDQTTDHTFDGDKTNLNSAVGNLIKNAVQAIGSKPDGKIDVALKSTGTTFVVSVKDNGKGIKEEDKSQIFLPNFTTKTGGSGVGLSLTYNIVQAAGGTISFESREGEGAMFEIVLPKT